MTKTHRVMKRWAGILGSMLALLPLGCTQQTSVECTDLGPVDNDPWVTRHECWGLAWPAWGPSTLIKIDKNRPNSELWVLEELENQLTATPQRPLRAGLHGRYLTHGEIQNRSQALVQINGFAFSCDREDPDSEDQSCWAGGLAYPISTVDESTHRLSDNFLPALGGEHLLSFGPHSMGPLQIQSSYPWTNPSPGAAGYYNAVGSHFPLLNNGECYGTYVDDWTAIGHNTQTVALLFAPQAAPVDMCQFMMELGMESAVRMDGGRSAGILPRNGTPIGHVDDRHIPYRIGLVTLEDQNRVENGGFELPDLSRQFGGTPPGYHSYSGQPIRTDLLWDGAMFLVNTPVYNRGNSNPLPSLGNQVAAIRTRSPDTNHIAQVLTVPAGRYCMLHFFHGYNNTHSPQCPDASRLTVRTEDCEGTMLTEAVYSSTATLGATASLKEVWLRLVTPSSHTVCNGTRMKLSFTAGKRDEDTPGNCEVLLDDVSVHCVQ